MAERRRGTRRDAGASLLQYSVVFALAAALAAAMLTAVPALGTTITEYIRSAVCSALGGEDCAEPESSTAAPEAVESTEWSAGDPAEEADLGDLTFPAPEDGTWQPVHAHHEPGGGSGFGPGGGVGPPAPPGEGTNPGRPPFHDEGSGGGEFNSEPLDGWFDYCQPLWYCRGDRLADLWTKYWLVAQGGGLMGMGDARALLLHFLGASGDPYEVDAGRMLDDVESFQDEVARDRDTLARDCITQAAEAGAEEPMTCQISTPWFNHAIDRSEDDNWFFALGSWFYGFTGEVTVHPPDETGGEWTYEMETEVNVIKTYDWDPDADGLGPDGMFDQAELAELHRAGMAQDFEVYGSTEATATSGSGRPAHTAPPCDAPVESEPTPC